jgi:secreted trypsin-like serine protease
LPSNYYPTKTKTFTTPTTVTTTISTTTTMRVPEKVDDEPKISFEELQKVCGTTSFKPKTTSGFIKNGKKAVRGQFPWLVSYFIRGKKGLQLSCGASLVSQKLLITAAHCVHPKGQIEPFKAENSIFVFGNEINDLTERFNDLSLAKELIIHPKWNSDPSTTYEYDIAIVVLSNNIIDFNKFIRPICLWTKTNDYSDMIGKVGTVAGWGKTEFDAVNTEGALYSISPVVKSKVCLDSNIEFAKIMSDKSFCAGEKGRDSGPCNGDSGGAFVFEENHKSYLRGIISSGIFNYAAQSCDPREYVVFTDVAKFTSWIKDYISRYG